MKCYEAGLKPWEFKRMKIGEVTDFLHGYELREAKRNNRARRIMSAMCGEDPMEIWPLFTDVDLFPEKKKSEFMTDEELLAFVNSLPKSGRKINSDIISPS